MKNILDLPAHNPQFLPAAEEVMKLVDAEVVKSESLSRYRKVRERMGEIPKLLMHPPEFPYRISPA